MEQLDMFMDFSLAKLEEARKPSRYCVAMISTGQGVSVSSKVHNFIDGALAQIESMLPAVTMIERGGRIKHEFYISEV